ncbi:MAG: signal peptidase II [Candidatus Zixiibacteriota bacterium]|nr:MAG: signal peptidase II [candidate division Zixibacteria bacterium]
MKKLLLPAVVVFAVAVADQLTKLWALQHLGNGHSVSIIGRFFMLTLVYNQGGAMGTNIGSPVIYLVLAIVILPFLGYYIYRYRHYPVMSVPLALIAGGAIGNLADRLRLGQVVDFLDVDVPDITLWGYQLTRWWTFNIADAAISCGIAFLVIYIIFFARRHETGAETGCTGVSATASEEQKQS